MSLRQDDKKCKAVLYEQCEACKYVYVNVKTGSGRI